MSSRIVVLGSVCAFVGLSVLAEAASIAPPTGAIPIFSDDFEDYTTTAELTSVWNAWPISAPTLAPGAGKGGGNGVSSTGGPVIQHNFAPVTVSDSRPVIVEADYWDCNNPNPDRNVVGLTGSGTRYEIGEYDYWGSGYVFAGWRTGGLGSGGGRSLSPAMASADPALGYHHMKLEIGSTYAIGTVTLSNGQTYTDRVTIRPVVGMTVDNIHIGGPINSAGSDGTAIFDNVQVYMLPEPSSTIVLVLGGLLAAGRMRTRRQ